MVYKFINATDNDKNWLYNLNELCYKLQRSSFKTVWRLE